MKRRNFLKSSAVASGTLLMPSFLQALANPLASMPRNGKTLVVIQLSGGNDGLNTIVPHGSDIYYRERPTLSIPKNEVIKLTDELGFHPSLAPLRKLFDRGEMTIINNVGYPNPDRSHFRSSDIWQTGSGSSEYWSTGWLGRYLDNNCSEAAPYHALNVDEGVSLALKGAEKSGFAMSNARQLQQVVKNPLLNKIVQTPAPVEENLSYLYKTLTDTRQSAEYLIEKTKVHDSKMTYPKGKFAGDLKQIAELMTAGTETEIYYVTLSGFDTHAGQAGKQQRLLKVYAEALAAFTEDLKSNNLFDDSLILTFSEFGRRVQENAGKGTDHGTANNVFLTGGKLSKNGFYNAAPNLVDLQNGDLVFDVDFRNVYATILENWLQSDSNLILNGSFKPLDFV